MKSSTAFKSAALLCSTLLSSVALGEPRLVQQGFDRSQCSNGMCTVVRVMIELDSTADKPVVRVARNDFTDGTVSYIYDTVVQRADDVCVKDVIVPETVFGAIANVFRSISAGGTPPPVLTPTQQTLLLFYTTLLQQTQGFDCTPRDLGEVALPTPPSAPPAPVIPPVANPFPTTPVAPVAPVAVPPAALPPIAIPPIVGNPASPLPPAPVFNTGGVVFQ